MLNCYVRSPDLSKNFIVFVSDDDIWRLNRSNNYVYPQNLAVRLTGNRHHVECPKISPDESSVAYLSDESGDVDCYVIPIDGGLVRRVTFFGDTRLVGWKDNTTLYVTSSSDSYKNPELFEIDITEESYIKRDLGHVSFYKEMVSGELLVRDTSDLAYWKNYKGGAFGQVWFKPKNRKSYQRKITSLKSNISNVTAGNDGEIYFLTDKDSVSMICQLDLKGNKHKPLITKEGVYIRDFSISGKNGVFVSGGQLFECDLMSGDYEIIPVKLISSFEETRKRFVPPSAFLSSYAVSNSCEKTLITTRGKLYEMNTWDGGVQEICDSRIKRFTKVLASTKDTLYVTVGVGDDGGDVIAVLESSSNSGEIVVGKLIKVADGKIDDIVMSPCSKYLIFTTSRNTLFFCDLKTYKIRLIDKGDSVFQGVDISPDSKWIVYSKCVGRKNELWISNVRNSSPVKLLKTINSDTNPRFTKDGKFVVFLGCREYKPQFAESHLDMSVIDLKKPYILALSKQERSIFELPLLAKEPDLSAKVKSIRFDCDYRESSKPKSKNVLKDTSSRKNLKKVSTKKTKKSTAKPVELSIDFEGVEDRVESFDVNLGGWNEVYVSSDRIFFTRYYESYSNTEKDSNTYEEKLISYQLIDGSFETVLDTYNGCVLSPDGSFLLYYDDEDLRLIPSDTKPNDGDEYSRADGWVSLDRVKVLIDPKEEWEQMFVEAWYLQKENFFNPQKRIDFDAVFEKYRPILHGVNTRSELSDLLRDMQGDLETSHAYEYGGDYRFKPRAEFISPIGAVVSFNTKGYFYTIEKLLEGANWTSNMFNPLTMTGVSLGVGDRIIKLNGRKFETGNSLRRELVNYTENTISLTVLRKGKRKYETLVVSTLPRKNKLAYHDWVSGNRRYVEDNSNGKIGYIHIPDMSMNGYSDFLKALIAEGDKQHLIVDIRFNEGGFASELILQKLSSPKLATLSTKWSDFESSYPRFGFAKNMTLITNGYTGSDGDIFAYAFKKLKLGKVVGTKTWGGVIGIWPRNYLVDGSITTQPEFNFEFDDKSGVVENKGVRPDIEIEISPDDYKRNIKPQLREALKLISL